MPTRDEIRRELLQIVADVAELPVDRVSEDAKFADLDIDSLRGLRIVAEVEKRYRVVISESEIGRIRSMADIFALMEDRERGE